MCAVTPGVRAPFTDGPRDDHGTAEEQNRRRAFWRGRRVTKVLKRSVGGVVFMALAMTDGAYAQQPQRVASEVHVCHGTNKYSIIGPSGGVSIASQPVAPTVTMDLRAGEAFSVWIADPNPLLFIYRAGVIERTPVGTYEAIQTFVRALNPLAEGQAQGLMGRRYVRGAREPREIAGNIRDSVSQLRGLSEQIEDLVSTTATPGWDCASERGGEARRAVKDRVARWRVESLAKRLADDYEALRDIAERTLSERPGLTEGTAESALSAYLLLALYLEDRVKAALERLEGFVRDVARIDERVLIVPEIAFEASQRQSVTINIEGVPGRTAQVEKSGRSVAAITFVVEPYTAVDVRVATGVVWTSFDRPIFTATEKGEAFEISKTINHTDTADVPAMLNVMPRKWRREPVVPFVQVGATGAGDDAVYFFGGGIGIRSEAFGISFGWAVTRIDRLVDQEVGQVVESATLEVGREFEGAPYLSLNVAF